MLETINQRICFYRKKLKLTQSQVGKMLGVKTSTYSQMERRGNITCENLIKLSEILSVDTLTLLYGKNIPQKIPEDTEKDVDGIPYLVAKDLYEKFAVLAMRNLPPDKKQEIYEFILEKFKEY